MQSVLLRPLTRRQRQEPPCLLHEPPMGHSSDGTRRGPLLLGYRCAPSPSHTPTPGRHRRLPSRPPRRGGAARWGPPVPRNPVSGPPPVLRSAPRRATLPRCRAPGSPRPALAAAPSGCAARPYLRLGALRRLRAGAAPLSKVPPPRPGPLWARACGARLGPAAAWLLPGPRPRHRPARPGPALPPLPPRSTGTAARPGRAASAVPLPGAVPDAGTVACRVPPRRRRGSREAPGAARGAPEGCGFRRRGCPRGLPRASGTRTAPGSSGAERGGRGCPRADGTAAGRGPPLGRGGSGLGPGAAAGSLCAADGEAAEGNGAPLPPPLRRRPRRALLSGLCPVGSGPAAPTALRRGLAAVTGGGCASRGPRGRLKAARESPWPFVSVLFFSRGCKSFVLFPTEVGLKANDLFLFREKSTEPNAPSGAVAVGSKVFAACEGANEKLHPRFFVFFFSSYRGAHNAIGAALSAEKSVVRGWIYNCWQCKAGNICNSKL